MTAAVAGRAAGAVRAGAVTQAEKDVLARKLAAARAAQGGGAQPVPPPVQKATTAGPAASRRPAPAPTAASRPAAPKQSSSGWRPAGGGMVSNGAGFVLALVFWGWVVLPFVKGGPAGVRDVIRAKFINKAADGSWLP